MRWCRLRTPLNSRPARALCIGLNGGDMTRPLRVLTIDGGGMRGVYTAAFLAGLAELFARERSADALDIGKGFDLIVGTSTGAIVGCGAAVGVPMTQVVNLYRSHGRAIFPQRLSDDPARVLPQIVTRPRHLREGATALQQALEKKLGPTTFDDLYRTREIALAIPAVELSQQRSWVFKTAHLGGVRDLKTTLVDACMATSAAPIFRSLHAIDADDGMDGFRVFADGGLWANNPVLVGLLEALLMSADRPVEVFAAGTIPQPKGERLRKDQLDRGLLGWKFGGAAAQLSIAAQEYAYDEMARMFSGVFSNLGRSVQIVRLPRGQLQPSLLPYLDIDNATPEAIDALIDQARADVNLAKSACDDHRNAPGQLIRSAFEAMPPLQ